MVRPSVLLLLLCPTADAALVDEVADSLDLARGDPHDGGALWVDLNQDGYPDLFTNGTTQGSHLMVSDGGAPPFFYNETLDLAPGLSRAWLHRSTLQADLNHDGWVDLIRHGSTDLEIYLGRGSASGFRLGTLAGQANMLIDIETFAGVTTFELGGIALLDFDRDGDLDIVAQNEGGVLVFENRYSSGQQFGLAEGVFPNVPLRGDYVAVADYDVDGDVDLMVRTYDDFDLFRNDGPGVFAHDTSFNAQATPDWGEGSVNFCDLDDDGDFDVVWTGPMDMWPDDEHLTRVYFNEGGTWETDPAATLWPGLDIWGTACADLDHDGDLDVVFASHTGESFVMVNQGDRTFEQNALVGSSSHASSVAIGDYDLDGDLDAHLSVEDGPNEVWRNDAMDDGARGHLYVRPRTELSETCVPVAERIWRDDVGSTVMLRSLDQTRISGVREQNGGTGRGNQGFYLVHFGNPTVSGDPLLVEVRFQRFEGLIGQVEITPSDLPMPRIVEVTDVDIDGDNILTHDELDDSKVLDDFDGDGISNWSDIDSDGDGISDAVEAGDDDPCTTPVDTDGDGDPDYLDLDSDNDGIPDGEVATTPGIDDAGGGAAGSGLTGGAGLSCTCQSSRLPGGWLAVLLLAVLIRRR